jgi:hypothetical protein
MNTYIIQRPERVYKLFYKNGLLYKLEGDPDLGDKFWPWFYKNKMDVELNIANYKSDNIKVEFMKATFDMFYQKYPRPVGKKKAQARWDKMKEDEQLAAWNYLPKYIRMTQADGIAFMHPITYLNSYRWED